MTEASVLWRLLEPYHAVVYFAPDIKDRSVEAGWTGFWMGYFAMRAAPLGPVPPSVVVATFFGFAPRMVERALPAAWDLCPPEQAWDVRLAIADQSLRRLLGERVGSREVRAAADLALAAVDAAELAGRPLAAATAARPVPTEAHLALWHAATVLREHRGDGHVAALVAAGVGPLEAHVLAADDGITPAALLLEHRGWTAEEWGAAEESARRRPPGLRKAIEAATDAAASGPWAALGPERTARVAELLAPLAMLIDQGQGVPYPNLMGVPRPGP